LFWTKWNIFVSDDDDDDYVIRQRLGYKPDAPPPNLSKVRSTINNRQNTAVRRRMEENKNIKPRKMGKSHSRQYGIESIAMYSKDVLRDIFSLSL
jgi:hypothetical protein